MAATELESQEWSDESIEEDSKNRTGAEAAIADVVFGVVIIGLVFGCAGVWVNGMIQEWG